VERSFKKKKKKGRKKENPGATTSIRCTCIHGDLTRDRARVEEKMTATKKERDGSRGGNLHPPGKRSVKKPEKHTTETAENKRGPAKVHKHNGTMAKGQKNTATVVGRKRC